MDPARNWADDDDDDEFAGDHEFCGDGTELVTNYAEEDGKRVKTVQKLIVKQERVNLAVEKRKGLQSWGDPKLPIEVAVEEKELFHIMPPRILASGADEEEPPEPAPSVVLSQLFKRVQMSLHPTAQNAEAMDRLPDHHHDIKQAEFKLRVTNLSESVTSSALRELFSSAVKTGTDSYDATPDVFMPINRQTNLPRGFAFITFKKREQAERAIAALDRHGFNNFVLGVEWAKPPRPR